MNLENPVCKSFQLKLIRAHSMLLLLKRKYENLKMKKIKSFFYKKGSASCSKLKTSKIRLFLVQVNKTATRSKIGTAVKKAFLKKCVLKAKVFKMSQKTCVKSFFDLVRTKKWPHPKYLR